MAGWRASVRELVAALASAGVTATCSRADGPRYGSLDLDSNVPDVRIAVGGPGVNPWTARLLAGLGPAGADLSARLAAPGGARVWVPAARPRAEVFTASADVRGDRDLPVLIVSGADLPAAVAELTRDLADAVIDAELAGGAPGDAAPGGTGPHDRLLGAHSVALLNRGTPSSLVTPDGTLHIALMRASSAWPAGVWIDGTRRTVPDGSSFAWQHWSHEFRYALAAGTGGWRDAGFVVAGQEYNHDLLACETGLHDGPLPASASLAEVSTPGRARPAALLSALKPRGNPLASGQPGRPGREAGVTIRLRDADGLPAGPAQVSLRHGITAAQVTDLTERGGGPAVEVAEGRALVAVPPAGLVTIAAMTPEAPAHQPLPVISPEVARQTGINQAPAEPFPVKSGGEPAAPPPGAEPVQPVFSRYWLHGKGPAPAGNLPVAVHLSPDQVTLNAPDGADSPGGLGLTVACGPGPVAGEVTLEVPPVLAITGPDGTPAGPFELLTRRTRLCPLGPGGGGPARHEAGAVLRVRAHHRRPRPGAGGHGAGHGRRAARARPRHAARTTGCPAGGGPGGAGSRGGGGHGARRPGRCSRRVRGAGRAAGQPDGQRDPWRVPAHVPVGHLARGPAVDPGVHRRPG